MAGLVSLLFIAIIPIDRKITNFPYTCLFTFLCNNYYNNIGELTSATSKESMAMNIIFAGTSPIK